MMQNQPLKSQNLLSYETYGPIKVPISEFGLSMLMLILLNHYMFVDVMVFT